MRASLGTEPGAQATQSVLSALATVPFVQVRHSSLWARETEPAGHGSQAVRVGEGVVPAGQAEQDVAPESLEFVPGGHGEQASEPLASE